VEGPKLHTRGVYEPAIVVELLAYVLVVRKTFTSQPSAHCARKMLDPTPSPEPKFCRVIKPVFSARQNPLRACQRNLSLSHGLRRSRHCSVNKI
jgi:hypothetical protein